MTILDTLKSLLGLETGDRRPETGEDVGVTVEREPGGRPDASSERSVEGGAQSGDEDAAATETTFSDEPSEPGIGGEGTAAGTTDSEGGDVAEDEGTTGDDSVTDEGGERDAGEDSDESPDVLEGIGPAYADRLADAGVETVADLADADASSLAEEADVSESRLERWIDRAKDR